MSLHVATGAGRSAEEFGGFAAAVGFNVFSNPILVWASRARLAPGKSLFECVNR